MFLPDYVLLLTPQIGMGYFSAIMDNLEVLSATIMPFFVAL